MRTRLVQLAAILAVVPLAAACGGAGIQDALSVDPVASAATRTSTAASMRVRFGGTVTGPWVGERVGFTGGGVVTAGGTSGRMHLRFAFPPAARARLGGDPTMDMIFLSKPAYVMYMRSPLFAKIAPASAPWLKLDLARIAARRGIDLDAFAQMKQVDPELTLGYLAGGGKSRELGWDRLRDGTLAKHYALTIDLRRLFKRGVQFRRIVKSLPGFAKRLPAEAWIDEHGYLRKLKLRFSLARSAAGPVQMTMTEEFSGFGVHARITPPPAGRVTDGTAFLDRSS